ncbi:MAG: 30S ribosomal protein S5 [Candidatus Woesearchaeota archaeon]
MARKKKQEEKKEAEQKTKEEVPAEQEEEIVKAEEIVAAEEAVEKPIHKIDVSLWKPKTSLGRRVKDGTVTDIHTIFESGDRILESEIIDVLLHNYETDLLNIGQSKGKFGGGKRRVFRQTQKKTKEGNKPKFATMAIIGNKDGFIGYGYDKAKETVPAREKAFRRSKLNVMMIRRGCGSWLCNCKTPHSVPFTVEGRCGSVHIKLIPAPKGTGLCAEKECAKILRLAGIKDVWTKTQGQTGTKINLVHATFDALRKLSITKLQAKDWETLSIVEGVIK